MKKLTTPLKLLAATAGVFFMFADQAEAHGGCPCGSVRGIVNSAKSDINSHTTSEINRLERTIEEHLQATMATIEAASNAEIESNTQTQNSANEELAEHDKRLEQVDNGLELSRTNDACRLATGGAIMRQGARNADARRNQVERLAHARNRNLSPETGSSAVAGSMMRVIRNRNTYCRFEDQFENAEGQVVTLKDCTPPGQTPEEIELLRAADLRAETIFRTGTYLSDDHERAAQRYIDNVVNPTPPEPLPISVMDDIRDGNMTPNMAVSVSYRDSRDARISLARSYFEWQDAMHAPTTDAAAWYENGFLADSVQQHLESTNDPLENNDRLSQMRMIELMVESRMTNPAWYAQVNSYSPTQTLKELAQMQALSLYIDMQRFEVEQHTAAAISTLLAIETGRAYPGASLSGTDVGNSLRQ